MNALLERNGYEKSKKAARELYQQAFKPMLDIIIASDPKKPEKMMAAL